MKLIINLSPNGESISDYKIQSKIEETLKIALENKNKYSLYREYSNLLVINLYRYYFYYLDEILKQKGVTYEIKLEGKPHIFNSDLRSETFWDKNYCSDIFDLSFEWLLEIKDSDKYKKTKLELENKIIKKYN